MKYEVEVTRVSYSTLTFGVEADSEEEAKDKALDCAYNTSFYEDDANYEVEEPREWEGTDEEFEEEYGE